MLFICFRYDRLLREVTIALVGKYTKLEDAYASVIKALQHSALAVSHRLNLRVGVVSSPELAQGELLGYRDVRRPSYVWTYETSVRQLFSLCTL